MNFDRNTIIGMILLAVLFFGFFYYTNKQQAALQKQRAFQDSVTHARDSIAKSKQQKQVPLVNNDTAAVANRGLDTTRRFPQTQAAEHLDSVENDLIKI